MQREQGKSGRQSVALSAVDQDPGRCSWYERSAVLDVEYFNIIGLSILTGQARLLDATDL